MKTLAEENKRGKHVCNCVCMCLIVCVFMYALSTSAVGIWVWGRDDAFGTMLIQNKSGRLLVTVIEVGGGNGNCISDRSSINEVKS